MLRNALQEGVCLSLPVPDVAFQHLTLNLNLPRTALGCCCWRVCDGGVVPRYILIIPAAGILMRSHHHTHRPIHALLTETHKLFRCWLLHRASPGAERGGFGQGQLTLRGADQS